ncbi:MAG TPA: cytidylate kinase-like family protein [Patescibacteria group bacterium]|nr:cytidylate kinase-like family protein [Patescibacteria group bacterium]
MDMSYASLVDKVMTALHLREATERSYANEPLVAAERFSKPFITIARDPGSGGKLVGQEVAKRLGFAFYDHELIEEIAKSTKLRKSVLDQVDEKGRTALQDLIQGLINPNYVSDVTYFTALCKVILSLAYRGNVVILGRGANFITPFAQGLHVRIAAPMQVCIQRAMDFEGHPYAVAKEIVQKNEADRREFVRQYFGKDIRRSDCYDLTINTVFFRPHEVAEIVIRAFEQKFHKSV